MKNVLTRIKVIPNLDLLGSVVKLSYQSNKGNSVLHLLAREPIESVKLDLIMDLLRAGFDPSVKNKDKTFHLFMFSNI